MNAQEHQLLINQFISLGGNPRLAKRLSVFSLPNFAKLKYELGKCEKQEADSSWLLANSQLQEATSDKQEAISQKPEANSPNKVFNDLIADYPVALHSTFRKRWELWMEACSWKIQLNAIEEDARTFFDSAQNDNPRCKSQDTRTKNQEMAFEVQMKIHECFQKFDHCMKILEHYKTHKRIMPTEAERDLSGFSAMQLLKLQNNLRASISRRKQTIAALEDELPEKQDRSYNIRLHSLNRKKEQLQSKINELMACEKRMSEENVLGNEK